MPEFWSAAVGAFFGLVTGLALEWWKAGRQDLADLCSKCCDVVTAAMGVSSHYWLQDGNLPNSRELEAQLIGYQRQVDGLFLVTKHRLHLRASSHIEQQLADFYDALTGGNFRDRARRAKMANAIRVQQAGNDAIVAIREGAYETASFAQSLARAGQSVGATLRISYLDWG